MTWNPQVIKSLLDSHAASNAAAGPRDPATVSGLAGIFANVPLMSALLAFLAAQITKLFTNYHEEGRWDWTRLIGGWVGDACCCSAERQNVLAPLRPAAVGAWPLGVAGVHATEQGGWDSREDSRDRRLGPPRF